MTSSRPHRAVLVVVPGAQSLDVTGPYEVLAAASQLARRSGAAHGYALELVAPRAGPVPCTSGLELVADRSLAAVRGPIDTLLVAGGLGTREAVRDGGLIRRLRGLAERSERVGSVCTGALLLAAAGLLDGRRATTHWSAIDVLRTGRPRIDVEDDAIYVRDGKYWTSAGVTAGIDLALAMVEEDLGRKVALEVARQLVVFLRRPGGQSQFSAQLSGQFAERAPLREVQAHIAEHPEGDLSVAALARRAGMSPRNFARAFSAEVGTTPARFVERSRVEAARRQLETTPRSLDEIASACGFGSTETLRRSFLRALGVNPSDYRERFRARRPTRREPSLASTPRRRSR